MSEWPAKSVSMQKTESLSPYDRNSRVHSERQIDQIVNSIREFGFTIPVLVDEKSMLIAGHGRVMAAQKMGLEEIPVMVATGWTDQQKRAYVIADNKLTENSTWDEELLKSEIKQLEFEEYNLDFLGFDVDDLTNLFLAKEFGDLLESHPTAKEELYEALCEKYIMKYRHEKEDGLDRDPEETITENE